MAFTSLTPEQVEKNITALEDLTTSLNDQAWRLTQARNAQDGAWSTFGPARTFESRVTQVTDGLLLRVEDARQEVLAMAGVLRTTVASMTALDESTSERLDKITELLSNDPVFTAIAASAASVGGRMAAIPV